MVELVDAHTFEGGLARTRHRRTLWSPASVQEVDDMYRGCYLSDRLEEAGLQHRLNASGCCANWPTDKMQRRPQRCCHPDARQGIQAVVYADGQPVGSTYEMAPLMEMAICQLRFPVARQFRRDVSAYLQGNDNAAKAAVRSSWRSGSRCQSSGDMCPAPALKGLVSASQRLSQARQLLQRLILRKGHTFGAMERGAAEKAPGVEPTADAVEIAVLNGIESLVNGSLVSEPWSMRCFSISLRMLMR